MHVKRFQLGLRHIAGFIVVSGAIFTIGVMAGRVDNSPSRYIRPPAVEPVQQVSQTNVTFAERVPAYPGSYEISIDGQFKDAFGFPTQVKTLSTQDPYHKVMAFYDRYFTAQSFNVYRLERPTKALAAMDMIRKCGYMVMLMPQRDKSTRVFVTFTDYKHGNPGHKTQMLPIEMDSAQPVVVSNFGRSNEMAVYRVDGAPSQVLRNCNTQLQRKGWKQLTAPEGKLAAMVKPGQRIYVNQNREMLLTVKDEGSGKTVLMCMIYPRMG